MVVKIFDRGEKWYKRYIYIQKLFNNSNLGPPPLGAMPAAFHRENHKYRHARRQQPTISQSSKYIYGEFLNNKLIVGLKMDTNPFRCVNTIRLMFLPRAIQRNDSDRCVRETLAVNKDRAMECDDGPRVPPDPTHPNTHGTHTKPHWECDRLVTHSLL